MFLTKLIALTAGASGMTASLVASFPMDTSFWEAVGKWPLTVILGVVCCFCVWLNYKQGVAFQSAAIKQAEEHRQAAERMAESNTDAITKLTHAQSLMIERLGASNGKLAELLMQRPCIRERTND